MLQVDEYAKMRLAQRDGMSIREIAKQFNRSRQVVRKVLENDTPSAYTPNRKSAAPKLDPVKAIIDQILVDDEQAPPKQRHTAMRIFERLVDEHGYGGGYDQVRRYVQTKRRHHRETFVPLSHEAGSRLECDFGHISVDFPDGRRHVPVLLLTWSYSHYCFAMAMPSEKVEAILHGTVSALEFFQCVPRELWWDNPTTVATEILSGRQRRLHPRYQALACHYNFEALFCQPRRGNEKPDVENRVKRLQRTWATPVPQVPDLEALNTYLLRCCQAEGARTVQRTEGTIGTRFLQDCSKALPLPKRHFDPCVQHEGCVDKYQTVRHDTNWYSVPRPYAFHKVTIKAYIDRLDLVFQGQVIAQHRRSYERHTKVLDALHYLAILPRKPAVLQHSPVFRELRLPAPFSELRQQLEAQFGGSTGTRRYIRVLQLLSQHPAERMARAISICLSRGHLDAGLIADQAERLAHRDDSPQTSQADLTYQDNLAQAVRMVQVKDTGLHHFDQLLTQGEKGNEQQELVPVAVEPQGASAAHHAR